MKTSQIDSQSWFFILHHCGTLFKVFLQHIFRVSNLSLLSHCICLLSKFESLDLVIWKLVRTCRGKGFEILKPGFWKGRSLFWILADVHLICGSFVSHWPETPKNYGSPVQSHLMFSRLGDWQTALPVTQLFIQIISLYPSFISHFLNSVFIVCVVFFSFLFWSPQVLVFGTGHIF